MSRTCPWIAALGLVALMGAPGHAKKPAPKPASPAAALTQAEKGLGSGYVSFPSSPRDRVEDGPDQSLAPYFYVAGGDPEKDLLPLKETRAEVDIAGVIAQVKVHQVFVNDGAKPIEAIYVFPASTRAAVHGMRMKIGERTVVAKIERKQAAREQYERAKQEGKRASLLEQERPNVFTMNVANIMPRDRIEVTLDYSELLIPEDAVYEFVYPTVVGPRYGGGADPQKDKWIANPYLSEGQPEPYKFDIKVHLETGIPIKELSSPSHQVEVAYGSKASADVTLAQKGGGNKDYVLRYRLSGDRIESGVLTFQGDDENFFVLMMEPPERPRDADIPSREYIFLLDVSGSMHGYPLDTAKGLMKQLLSKLRPSDYLNVALFSGASYVMHPKGSVAATAKNIQDAIDVIMRQQGGGGTELMGGLQAVYGVPKPRANVSRSVVVVTDGYVGVEAQAFKFIRDNLDQANLFAFGIGSAVNRGLIEGMARAGQGEPFVVLRPEKAEEQAEKLRAYIQQPVLAGIQVRFDGFDAIEVAPMKVPDLMARRPVILFGKYRGEAKGKIRVRGNGGRGVFEDALEVKPAKDNRANAPLRFLWARKWVSILDDAYVMSGNAKEVEEVITDLGLAYTLLTQFTSFVAVDSEVVNKGGQQDTVQQALPLPEGVSNLAVGGAMKSSSGYGQAMSRSMAMPAASPPPGYAPERKRMATKEEELAAPEPASVADSADVGGPQKLPKPKKDAALQVTVRDLKADGLSEAELRQLSPLIRSAVSRATGRCQAGAVQLKVRITVDASGKPTKVEMLNASDQKVATCLSRALRAIRFGQKKAFVFTVTIELK